MNTCTDNLAIKMKKNTAALLELIKAIAAAQKQNDDENSLFNYRSFHPDVVVKFTDKPILGVTDKTL